MPVDQRRIADDGNDMLVRPLAIARGGKPHCDGKRAPGMSGDGRIRGAFGGIRKRRDAVQLAQGVERLATAVRQELPGIGLMSDIPHDAVFRRLEDFRKRHRDLDRAEGRGKMSAVLADGLQNAVSQFLRCHLRFRINSGVAFCPNASSRPTSSKFFLREVQ